jgi:hypothetical protein
MLCHRSFDRCFAVVVLLMLAQADALSSGVGLQVDAWPPFVWRMLCRHGRGAWWTLLLQAL